MKSINAGLILLYLVLFPGLVATQELGQAPPQTVEQASGSVQKPNLLQEYPAESGNPFKGGTGAPKKKSNNALDELEKKVSERVKDPFMIPNDIYLMIKQKLLETALDTDKSKVDDTLHPKWRWPLRFYKLVAVIWNVSKPKAMITDRDRNMHMYYVGDEIGNRGGVITSIEDGYVNVIEEDREYKLSMYNESKNENN